MKSLFSVFIGLVFSTLLMSQEVLFSALAVNGTCMIQRGANPDEFVHVKKGENIFTGDKIIVTGATSYIGLITPTGKVTEITSGGVYFVNDLTAKLVSGSAPVLEEYSNVLAQHLTETKTSSSKYLMYTGSVDRSIEEVDIDLFLPDRTKISKNKTSISWSYQGVVESYTVNITDLYEESVFNSKTADNNISIDFASLELRPGQVYRVTVSLTKNPSKKSREIVLQVPTRSQLAKFETDLKMLQSEVPSNSAIGDMVFATYFQEQGLYLEAIPYFKSAINKEPNIEEYKNAYDVFLYRVGL